MEISILDFRLSFKTTFLRMKHKREDNENEIIIVFIYRFTTFLTFDSPGTRVYPCKVAVLY